MNRTVLSVAVAIMLAALWWLMVGEDPSSWLIGIPAILSAAAAAWLLAGPTARVGFTITGLVRFAPFFLAHCFLGGLDVSTRAFRATISLEPVLIEWRTRLPCTVSRVMFASVISLIPGTLAADLRGDRLTVHLLDGRTDYEADLRRVERVVASLFGIELGEPTELTK
ncbi:MAG: cation transporter [Planctomycetes bacterium]|nr:cation transporter [Planctomycetota bacterium]